jgi:hypothetical protein
MSGEMILPAMEKNVDVRASTMKDALGWDFADNIEFGHDLKWTFQTALLSNCPGT